MIRFLISISLVIISHTTPCLAVDYHLYINRGYIAVNTLDSVPYIAFNESQNFSTYNTVLKLVPGDTLNLRIENTDSIGHSFMVSMPLPNPVALYPGIDTTFSIFFPDAGLYSYYDNTGLNRYMGLGGMISVNSFTGANFYWNLRDHQADWNRDIALGINVDPATYLADHFTINGHYYPVLQNDSTAIVNGYVNDTIRIHIANLGLMEHSFHFHGYHLRILASSSKPDHVGRLKDSFPVRTMDNLVLELVPQQPGLYPVHDHNLVATTIGGNSPGGMIMIISIQ